MKTIYERLCDIAARFPDLLVHFEDDLRVCDKEICQKAQAGEEYVWILRKCGTAMVPLRCGYEPTYATYWLKGDAKAFHVKVMANDGANGSIEEISFKEATDLVNLPPPRGICSWVPRGFALVYKCDGSVLGRVSNVSGRGWDAEIGTDLRSTHIGRFDSFPLAKDAVEMAVAHKAAA